MKTNPGEKKYFEITIEEICGIQAEIEDLVTKCGAPMAPSHSVAHSHNDHQRRCHVSQRIL